jgi:hypothetical protein
MASAFGVRFGATSNIDQFLTCLARGLFGNLSNAISQAITAVAYI